MIIKIPETYMGKPIKGAMDLILACNKSPVVRTRKKSPVTSQQAPDLNGFIYVPSINLYVAREKTLHTKNWTNAHKELQKQELQMLTIPQFVEFIRYVEGNSVSGKDAILNEIREKKDPWRSEWLDAYFIEKEDEMHIAYNHRFGLNGKLKPQKTEKLEKCILGEGYIDLMSANSQGLPTKKSRNQDIYFYPPLNKSVAGFGADSGGAVLYCGRDPSYTDSSLGVRAAREKISGMGGATGKGN